MRHVILMIALAATFCMIGEAHAAKVTYTGEATITTDTSGFLLSASDLGFATGTNLQGVSVDFSVVFDSASFAPDLIPADPTEATYPYTGVSSYTFQVAGGNLVSNELLRLSIDDEPGSDTWAASSTLSAGGSTGVLILEGPVTVFDDDSLRTLVDPADFTTRQAFVLLLDLESEGGGSPGLDSQINVLFVTEEGNGTMIPTPAAAGAGLVLLGGLLTKRERRHGR